jgi:hypothetical protein
MPLRQPPILRLILFLVLLLGTAATAWGLYQPLVRFPVVGALQFSQASLGGSGAASAIIAALLVASLLLLVPNRAAKLGLLVGGLAIGYLGATLLAIYRSNMDKALELADSSDSGIRALLEAREYQPAAWVLAVGIGIWVLAAILTRLHDGGSTAR